MSHIRIAEMGQNISSNPTLSGLIAPFSAGIGENAALSDTTVSFSGGIVCPYLGIVWA